MKRDQFLRVGVIAILVLLAFSVGAAASEHYVFSEAGKEGGGNDFVLIAGPEARTVTFAIEATGDWRITGSVTRVTSETKWKWSGKGNDELKLAFGKNTEDEIGFLSIFQLKTKTYGGSFAMVQLSEKDYLRYQAMCDCGAERVPGVTPSVFKKAGPSDELKRLMLKDDAKNHALLRDDFVIACKKCGQSMTAYVFALHLPGGKGNPYGTEKHNFAGGIECVDCGYERELKATRIALTAPKTVLTLGEDDVQLGYTLTPANSNSTVIFTSSNSKVATVDAEGMVTPVGAGKATITAKTSSGKKASVKLTVVDPKLPVSIRILPPGAPKALKLDIGQSVTLEAVVLPETAQTGFIWTSGKKNIAAVTPSLDEPGKATVTGQKKGTTWIQVKTSNGKTAKVKVVVSKIPYAPPVV